MRVHEGLHDIGSRADCERLVRAFYGRTPADPIIGFIFVDVVLGDDPARSAVLRRRRVRPAR